MGNLPVPIIAAAKPAVGLLMRIAEGSEAIST
jgi:hypothetical protein